ncbi:hypothetical protein DFH28DRAFT_1009464, partial [Melampsora americana]
FDFDFDFDFSFSFDFSTLNLFSMPFTRFHYITPYLLIIPPFTLFVLYILPTSLAFERCLRRYFAFEDQRPMLPFYIFFLHTYILHSTCPML